MSKPVPSKPLLAMLLVLPPASQPAPGAGRTDLDGRARAPCVGFVGARCFPLGCLPASPAARLLPLPTDRPALPLPPPRRPPAPQPLLLARYRETPPRACAARAVRRGLGAPRMRRGSVLFVRRGVGGGGGRRSERAAAAGGAGSGGRPGRKAVGGAA